MKSKIILLAVAVMIVAFGTLSYKTSFLNLNYQFGFDNQNYACTEEALMCPDGSGVGRSGPKCEFNACSGQASYDGTLIQVDEGLGLDLVVNDNFSEKYVLPLNINVSNALEQLYNQRVRVNGAFEKGNIFKVDTIIEL